MYSYIATSHKATATQLAITCNFTSLQDKNLILVKGNCLEIRSFRDKALFFEKEVQIFGKIASITCYRPSSTPSLDVIFVLTEKKHFCILGYDVVTNKIITRATGSVKDRVGREIDLGIRAIVDPSNRVIALSLYEGSLKILPIDGSSIKDSYNIRLKVSKVIDLNFIHGCSRPTLALLYENASGQKVVKTLVLDLKEKDTIEGPWAATNVEATSKFIIPVPSPTNGILVVGESMILYLDGTGAGGSGGASSSSGGNRLGGGGLQSVLLQADICAYGALDAEGSRYLIGDSFGVLRVLLLSREAMPSLSTEAIAPTSQPLPLLGTKRVTGLIVDVLGRTNIPSSISYLGEGMVFIGCIYGDSQLIRLNPGNKQPLDSSSSSTSTSSIPDESIVDLVETFTNIGPILDMCVVGNDASSGLAAEGSAGAGSCQIVTCSGAFQDGSLRVISSGIGIHEQASIDLPGIRNVWSLKLSLEDTFDKYLVQSFTSETRILGIDEEEMSEVDAVGLETDEPTLYCSNMIGQTIIQVTPSKMRLLDSISFSIISERSAPSACAFTVASGNSEQLVVALSGGRLLYFEISRSESCAIGESNKPLGNLDLFLVKEIKLDHEVACINLRPVVLSAVDVYKSDSTMTFDEDTNNDTTHPKSKKRSIEGSQESSAAHPGGGGRNELALGRSELVAVGLWTINSLHLFSLPSLDEVVVQPLGSETQARDVLLVTLGADAEIGIGDHGAVSGNLPISSSPTYLLIGLGDGTLLMYSLVISTATGLPALVNRKSISLGLRALNFSCFSHRETGKLCVFVCCDRPCVIYSPSSSTASLLSHSSSSDNAKSNFMEGESSSTNKLVFSKVNFKSANVTCMAPFHSALFPNCLALSSFSSMPSLSSSEADNLSSIGTLTIGTVDEIQKIHIQTFHIHESPRRIAFMPSTELFAVLTEKSTLTEHGVDSINRILFLKQGTMQQIYVHNLDYLEQGLSCIACELSLCSRSRQGKSPADVINVDEDIQVSVPGISSKEYVIVGTAYSKSGDMEPSRGRILVFEVVRDSSLMPSSTGTTLAECPELRVRLIAETVTKGGVFSLAPLNGKLVACIGSKVQAFLWTSPNGNAGGGYSYEYTLQPDAVNTGHVMALYMKTYKDHILVGDLFRSVSLLEFMDKPSESARSLKIMSEDECNNNKIIETARDFHSHYMRAVEFLSDDSSNFCLGADDSGNFFAVRQQVECLSAEDRRRMEPCGEFHLGDFVNVFRKGSLNGQPMEQTNSSTFSANLIDKPSSTGKASDAAQAEMILDESIGNKSSSIRDSTPILFGTVSGSIGTIIPISYKRFQLLSSIEKALKSIVSHNIGCLSHDDYRNFYNGRRSMKQRNMIDGDLVERLLDLSPVDLTLVVRQVNDDMLLAHSTATSSGSSASTSGLGLSGLIQEVKWVELTADECIRVVEEMSRQH